MKKKILDLMIDFETFGRQVNSVPINLAVMAFDRYSESDPFVLPDVEYKKTDPHFFSRFPMGNLLLPTDSVMAKSRYNLWTFDVTACLTDGFVVEPETQQWWMGQSENAKSSLAPSNQLSDFPEMILSSFCDFVGELRKQLQAEEVCIWSQGSDFDIAKLRYLMDKYGYNERLLDDCGVTHTSWRDARTAILEMGAKLFNGKRGFSADLTDGTMFTDGDANDNPNIEDFHEVYDHIVPLEVWAKQMKNENDGLSNYLRDLAMGDNTHNSVYDCMCSVYNVWWLSKALETQML